MYHSLFLALEQGPKHLSAQLDGCNELFESLKCLLNGKFPDNIQQVIKEHFYKKNPSFVEQLLMDDITEILFQGEKNLTMNYASYLLMKIHEHNLINRFYINLIIYGFIILEIDSDEKLTYCMYNPFFYENDFEDNVFYENVFEDNVFVLYQAILNLMETILKNC